MWTPAYPAGAGAVASPPATARPHAALVANTGWNIVRFRAELVAALIQAGWEVTVVAAFDERQADQMRAMGARPVALTLDAAGVNPLTDLAYAVRLARVLRRLRPDLVHLFTIKPIIYGGVAAKLVGTSGIVASFTGLGILRAQRRRWLRPLLRPLVRAAVAGRTVATLQNPDDHAALLAERVLRPSGAAVCISGSGVDTEKLAPDTRADPAGRTCFIMASRMLWSKGVADFVAAARIVKPLRPQASFVLFGGCSDDYGSKNPDFIPSAWLEQLNREGIVAWRGWTDPAAVEAAMRGCAAVVLPSWYAEGVPRSLIEAAAAGAPIITSDMPGCRDTVIDGRSGFLCPPHAPQRLADAMLTLLARPGLIAEMGREGRRLAVATFDTRTILAQTMAAYRQALSAANRTDRLQPRSCDRQ